MRDWSRRHTLAALLAAGGSTIPMGWVYAQARKAEAAPLPGDYMGKGLRERVEALKAEAATTPQATPTIAIGACFSTTG